MTVDACPVGVGPVGVGPVVRSPEQRVRALLSALESLPPMPPVARRLMDLGDLTLADIADVSAVIELDPALTVGVLKMCRAAHAGLGDRITTVRHAVTMLGVDAVRRLVLTTAVCESLREGAAELDERTPRPVDFGGIGAGGGFDRHGYWVYSVAVACASESISAESGRVAPARAFVAGLLHGLGRFALELVAPRAVGRLCALAAHSGVDASVSERRVLGLDHAEAGAHLARVWGLTDDLISVIEGVGGLARFGPGADAHADLVASVVAGRWLCRSYHIGWSGDWSAPGDGEAAMIGAGLDAAAADGIASGVVATLGERLSDLGLVGGSGKRASASDVAVMMARQANRELSVRRAA